MAVTSDSSYLGLDAIEWVACYGAARRKLANKRKRCYVEPKWDLGPRHRTATSVEPEREQGDGFALSIKVFFPLGDFSRRTDFFNARLQTC